VQWPEVGLTALRMESQSPSNMIPGDTGSSILTWRDYQSVDRTELYCRYLLRIDPDVYVGMTEIGVKLPGFEGSGFSYRMEHGAQSDAHPGVFRLVFYAYDFVHPFDDPNRGSVARKTAVCLAVSRIYSVEQHVRLNTITTAADGTVTPNKDGVIEVFVDGVLVYSDYAAQITATTPLRIKSAPFANFFHGGSKVPSAPIHYEFCGVASSLKYIGAPQRASVSTTPTGGSMDLQPLIDSITNSLNLAYADAGLPSVAQQLTDAQNALATANANLATANTNLAAANTTIANLQAEIATAKTDAAANVAAAQKVQADLP
jgi:hypothetical protein